MDEKAWHLYSDDENVILGLGSQEMVFDYKDKYEHLE